MRLKVSENLRVYEKMIVSASKRSVTALEGVSDWRLCERVEVN